MHHLKITEYSFIDAFHLYIAFEKIKLNEHTVLICTGKDIKQRDLCQHALSMTKFNDRRLFINLMTESKGTLRWN